MKENRKNNYLIKYVVVLAILIAMTILACAIPKGIGSIDNDMLQDISNSGFTNTSFNVNYPTSGGLGQFDNGVTYVYTDPEKIDDFRAGTISRDITEVTVDTSKPHGTSQQNPYVISTLADWDNFVKRMATGTNYGSGEYFVLANDLDFDGEAFHPVVHFNGTFNGLGFALKNISCSVWQYWNSSTNSFVAMPSSVAGFGTFCHSLGALITDLIVENYEFLEIPLTNQVSSNIMRCSNVGGIVGYSTGNIQILNCHTLGIISSQTASNYGAHTSWGGLLGETFNSLIVYRCSAKTEMTSHKYGTSMLPIFGGLVGGVYDTANYNYIYDSVADLTANVSGGSTIKYIHVSSVVAITHAKQLKIENVVAETDITSSHRNASGGVAWQNTKISTSRFFNIYSGNFIGASGATKLPLYMMTSDLTCTTSNSQISNLHLVKPSSLSYQTIPVAYIYSFTSSSPAQPILHETFDDIYDKAKQDVDDSILPSKIWDKSKIGGYTPADTPVRNFLTANVTFKNLLSGGGEEGLGIDTAEYRAGDALPSPSGSYLKTNHTFRGWTTDKTGKSDPVTELPTGVFGDVTYYAVWGLTDSYVASQIKTSLSVKDNIKTIEYDSVSSIG
ncbi:MAG: InlB B-repeat-containing protein, partial [Clostridia bacterium]|nr:InlB B-repeat-containing protein [Clostridia bacterium]